MTDQIDVANYAWEEAIRRAPVRLIECVESAIRFTYPKLQETEVSYRAERGLVGLRRWFQARMKSYGEKRQTSPLEWSVIDPERLVLVDLRLRHIPTIRSYLVTNLTGDEFQRLCASILQLAGCQYASSIQPGPDEGVDIVATFEPPEVGTPRIPLPSRLMAGPRTVVLAQCKRFGNNVVGVERIREFIGAASIVMKTIEEKREVRVRERLRTVGARPFSSFLLVYFTTSYFTDPAVALGKAMGVVLVDGEGVAQSIMVTEVLPVEKAKLEVVDLDRMRTLIKS